MWKRKGQEEEVNTTEDGKAYGCVSQKICSRNPFGFEK